MLLRLSSSAARPRTALALFALACGGLAFGGEIHDAAANGDLGKIKALLKTDPTLALSKDRDGMTPLHFAADTGHKDLAEFLLASNADVNARDGLGRAPLHYAAAKGHANVVELLLAHGADVNARDTVLGRTPLHYAARNGHDEAAELLLSKRADVNARDNQGQTVLNGAVETGHEDMQKILRQHGAGLGSQRASRPLTAALAPVAPAPVTPARPVAAPAAPEPPCAARSREPVDRNSHDHFFLGVPFGIGNAEVMHLSNTEKKEQTVKIETHSASGCLLQEVEKTVPGSGAADVRVELAQLKPEYGWIRVVSKNKGIAISSAQEVLRGNVLSTVPGRHPTTRGPEGRLTKLNHRWSMDLTKDTSVLEYFINLSEHPVQLGVCEADRPNFFCKTLSHTVAPMAQIGIRIDRSHKYLVIESTAGYSAAMGINFVNGNKQVFDSSSSIKFDDSAPQQ